MNNIFLLVKKYLYTRTFLGVIIGIVGGFAYYYYIGCSSGSCPITSNPYISVLYGGLMGGILFYKPKKKKNQANNETQQNEQGN